MMASGHPHAVPASSSGLRAWMTSIALCMQGWSYLQSLARTVEIPRSMPELTTERLLVMSFVEGDQITRLEHRTKDLSARFGCFCSYQCTSAARNPGGLWADASLSWRLHRSSQFQHPAYQYTR